MKSTSARSPTPALNYHFTSEGQALYAFLKTPSRIQLCVSGFLSRASAFLIVALGAGYLTLSSTQLPQVPQVNDKALHFVISFILTLLFYWILDTTRRRALNLTLLVVTGCLGLGSEALQGLLPNGHQFDPIDIAANVLGSLLALGLCSIYHKRMLDRRRKARGYGAVPSAEQDVELGAQGSGITEDDGGEGSTDGDGRLTPSSWADEGHDAKT